MAFAPFVRINEVAVDVFNVVLVWKIHWESDSFMPSRVNVEAENSNLPVAEQYRPGAKVSPARS